MKKALKYLPIVLYPYLYVPIIICYFTFLSEKDTESKLLLAIIIACNVICFLSSLIGTIQVIRGKIDSRQAIKANLIIKLGHIPAYIIHFLIGLLGFFMGIFGIGFVVWSFIMGILSIGISGIYAFGCCIRAYKDGKISIVKCILSIIGSFTYCIDILVAILLNKRMKMSP